MRTRLREVIRYKTGGKQAAFAALMGWSPQYLAKLLKGTFGLQPALAILSAFPEINARWLLLGQGGMLDDTAALALQHQAAEQALSLLSLSRCVSVMTAVELGEFAEAVRQGRRPDFPPETLADLQRRLSE